jgi:mannose-6-phosphate isomerase-like protein (cupin superfamily)
MEKVSIGDVDAVPHWMGANTDRRPLSRHIEGMDFATTYLELDPGEAFSGGLHIHTDQEELFLVLEGTATWETKEEAGGESTFTEVGPMEAIHFGEGDVYQTGRNETDEVVRGIAIGVPGSRHNWEGTRALIDCATCGEETVFTIEAEGRMPDIADTTITCTECGTDLEV